MIKLNNGIEIPQIGLGTWQLSPKDCEQAVLHALKTGYKLIDTAAIYKNEEAVSTAIKKSKIPREEIFLTTKLWNSDHKDPLKAFNTSLKKLQTDYIDLYLIHWPVPELRNKTWKILEKIYKSKKCKAIGVSNYTPQHLKELFEVSEIIPTINQVEFSPFLYQKDLLNYCNTKKIQVEAYSPLTQGQKLNEPELKEIAKKYKKTSAQIILRWCIQHNTIPLPKSKTPSRIEENFNIFDFKISTEDMESIDTLHENFRTCWDPTEMS